MNTKQTVQKASRQFLAVDVGHAFTKIGIFERQGVQLKWLGLQLLPSLQQGLFLDPPLGLGETSLDPVRLLRSGAPRFALSTTRLPTLHLMIAGYANDHIEDSLFFCEHLGIEVEGVLSHNKMLWENDSEVSLALLDGVILVGGFERRKEKALFQLVERLALQLEETERAFPIFFVGSEELREKIRNLLPEKHPVSLIPNLWPGKSHKDFLKLFVELQQIALYQAREQDEVLSRLQLPDAAVESGMSALLSALSLYTRYWQANVLLVDIGSQQTTACWSYHHDGFSIPVWDQNGGGEALFETGDNSSGERQHYGVKRFPGLGLGGSVQEALSEINSEELAALWPVQEEQSLRDRVLNHSLYPAVIPDGMDRKWQNALVRSYFRKIWARLPAGYQPTHVIFSGSFFSAGLQNDSFVEDVVLPSNIPFSSRLWVNRGPVIPLVGLLSQFEPDPEVIAPEQFLTFYGDYVRLVGKPDRSGTIAHVSIDTNQDAVEAFEVQRGETHIVGIGAQHKALVRILPGKKAAITGYGRGEEVILRSSGSHKGILIDGRAE